MLVTRNNLDLIHTISERLIDLNPIGSRIDGDYFRERRCNLSADHCFAAACVVVCDHLGRGAVAAARPLVALVSNSRTEHQLDALVSGRRGDLGGDVDDEAIAMKFESLARETPAAE
jgi:hypothetical protein